MEEDIKLLEEKIKKMITGIAVCRGNNDTDYARIMNKEKQALENLIKGYREQKESIKIMKNNYKVAISETIHKSKIQEKIEEVNKSLGYSPVNKILIEQVLQELIKEAQWKSLE